MKKILTNNIGLKIISLLAAFILWVVVVNVDNPVVKKTFQNVPVEVTNADAISNEGKTFEIIGDSDTISVTVEAQRSVIESMSSDFIKATADMRNITFMNTVPIELKVSRFSERITSLSTRTPNLAVVIEEELEKQIKIVASSEGKVAKGYIVGEIDPALDVITVSGPESLISTVKEAKVVVDVSDMNETFTSSCDVVVIDKNGEVITNPMLEVSKSEISTKVEILETKEIPVTAYYTGTPAQGFSATGTVICEPSSVVIAGKGTNFDKISSVRVPDSVLSVDGVNTNATKIVNIEKYLPSGVIFADENFSGDINLIAVIEAHDRIEVSIPKDNISVINLPEGYTAHIVSGEDSVKFEVSGLQADLDNLINWDYTAVIDAMTLIPRDTDDDPELEEGEEKPPVNIGQNDGPVLLNLPQGITQNSIVNMEVIINAQELVENTEDD